MSSQIEIRAFGALKAYINKCADSKIGSKYMESDGEKLFVNADHLFSDTSQVSLRARVLSIYPIHITALNIL